MKISLSGLPTASILSRLLFVVWIVAADARAEPPDVAYIFPAGGQRGTTVPVRVGGFYLHEGADFRMTGPGIEASRNIERQDTIWFEGPVIPQPASQRKEDYPVDYAGTVSIDETAACGIRRWHVFSEQGVTRSLPFVVGMFPEVVEEEVDGRAIPEHVELPVTINGRTFPREDVDIWTFDLEEGQIVTCVVHAARLGSSLDARVEVRDPEGRRVAEDSGTFGADPFVRFTATMTGRHAVHVHDAGFGGLQHYVYRLTLTTGPYVDSVFPLGGAAGETVALTLQGANLDLGRETVDVALPDEARNEFTWRPDFAGGSELGFPLHVSAFPESLEEAADGGAISVPGVANGRIETPGTVDSWTFAGTEAEAVTFQVLASTLGSPLDAVIQVLDDQGAVLAEADDDGPSLDPRLTFTPPVDGLYMLRISDRVPSRGGLDFSYRVQATTPECPDRPPFSVVLPTDAFTITRGETLELKIDVQRHGFDGEIALTFEGLPDGVSQEEIVVAARKVKATLKLTAADNTDIAVSDVRLVGTAEVDGQTVAETARLTDSGGRSLETARLAVAVPTPFRFSGIFESRFAPRGSVYTRHYTIDRGGFEGPIAVSLSDTQVRHLQGVRGPTIIVPPGESEFDYPVHLPPFLEVGRTSRTCLMAVGEVPLDDGRVARTTYTSQAQADQIIVLTAPELLSVSCQRETVPIRPGAETSLRVNVNRSGQLNGPVQVELICPAHVTGVSADPVTIDNSTDSVELSLRIEQNAAGPFNMPLTVRASTRDERGDPVVAEDQFEIVR